MTFLPTQTSPAQPVVPAVCASLPALWVKKPVMVLIAGLFAFAAQEAKATSEGATSSTESAAAEGPSTADFDTSMLQSRGLDPKVAEFFSQAPRFSEGVRRIELHVNGSQRGGVDARFDDEGQLCFTQGLLDRANLIIPAERFSLSGEEVAAEDRCYDFISAFPQTEVELRPNREEVSLLVSNDALRPISEDMGAYQYGGVGGLFNYEVLGQKNEFSSGSSSYYLASTELGFNAGDWMVRSRQSFSMQDEQQNFQSLYTYAQKTFVPYKSTLQLGQINISNSVFPGAAITGAQVIPDAALLGRGGGGATVEGIAQSAARVEVRQSGALIHTSLVPAGPFLLPNIQLLNGRADLDVRVIEADGQEHSFTIPAASLGQVEMTAAGFSMAAGQVRTFDSKGMQSPMVVTASNGWTLNSSSRLSAGLMASDNAYQAAGLTFDASVTPATTISVVNTLANAGEEGVKGAKVGIAASTRLTKNMTASVNLTRQSEGFRDLLDTTRADDQKATSLIRDQYGFSLGWNDPLLGGLTTSFSTSNNYNGRSSRHLNLSWSKQFKHATVGVNVERSTSAGGVDDNVRFRNTDGSNKAVYLTVSVPLGGKRSARAYANTRDGDTRFGTTYDDSSNDFASYRLSAERDEARKQQNFSGNVNMVPRYAQVNLGYSSNGPDSTSFSGQLRGAAAIHGDGVTLSPYHLSDTFGVAKVGDVAGVKLSTPSGPVWTDTWGNAVIPQMNAYQATRVEIETKTLPRNVDLQNGFKSVSAARGSVNKIDFPVIKSRRAMLNILGADGKPVAKGAAVLDSKGKFVTTVVDDGKVFLANGQLTDALSIDLGEGKSCAINFTLPEEPDLDVYFETAKATCVAG